MSAARKILIVAGLEMAIIGMLYGLVYAVFVEHQTLDALGATLTAGFLHAANGDLNAARASIGEYSHVAYNYVRHVDAHSHWIGLAMLLLVLGLAFDRVSFAEQSKLWLAVLLVAGSAVFPLGVLMQTWIAGPLPQVAAAAGATAVTAGLAGVALGFARAH